ncbi:hypothetical protein M0R19_07620 [Candidatus Pacearchaeota archaeon]|nr:hypothetical protein [Candidatus Pacearchaeota archaeon]
MWYSEPRKSNAFRKEFIEKVAVAIDVLKISYLDILLLPVYEFTTLMELKARSLEEQKKALEDMRNNYK